MNNNEIIIIDEIDRIASRCGYNDGLKSGVQGNSSVINKVDVPSKYYDNINQRNRYILKYKKSFLKGYSNGYDSYFAYSTRNDLNKKIDTVVGEAQKLGDHDGYYAGLENGVLGNDKLGDEIIFSSKFIDNVEAQNTYIIQYKKSFLKGYSVGHNIYNANNEMNQFDKESKKQI